MWGNDVGRGGPPARGAPQATWQARQQRGDASAALCSAAAAVSIRMFGIDSHPQTSERRPGGARLILQTRAAMCDPASKQSAHGGVPGMEEPGLKVSSDRLDTRPSSALPPLENASII